MRCVLHIIPRMNHVISILLLFFASFWPAPQDRTNLLWYRQPATKWNEALPIGNGRLGAMVFGGVESERIQLNEDSIWAGEKRDRNNPEGAKNLAEVRRLLFAGKPREAEALAERTIISIPKRLPPYQPLGDLLLRFSGHSAASNYVRELDLDSGIARVTYQLGDARFSREVFSSAVDQVIVIRLASDKPGRLSFAATLSREQDSRTRTLTPNRVVIEGEAIARDDRHEFERKVGVKFQGVLQVLPEGGNARLEGSEVVIDGANAATLVFAAATSFRHKDVAAGCEEYLIAAKKPYAQLRAAHISDHQRLFRRVEFRLAGPVPDLPTDERLRRVAGRRDRSRARDTVLPVRTLSADCKQSPRLDGGDSAGHLERSDGAVLGQ